MAKQFITNIDLNDNQIKNLGYPTEQNDGISKEFLDEYAIDFLNITTFSLSNLNTTPPSLGEIRLNANNTELYIHKTDNLNFDCENLITNLDIGSNILIRQISDTTRWVIFTINSITDNTTYFTINIEQLKISNIGFPNTNELNKVIFFSSSNEIVQPQLETQNEYDYLNSIKIQYNDTNSGGDINTEFQINGSDFTGNPVGMYVYNDLVYVYGNFTEYKGSPVGKIIRLNKNGDLDNTFNNNISIVATTNPQTFPQVSNLEIYKNEIYVDVNSANIININNSILGKSLFKLDINGNVTDRDFISNILNNNIGTTFSGGINFFNDKIYLTTGTNNPDLYDKGLVKLNLDGTIDNTLDLGNGFNQQIRSIDILNNGKIICVGSFTEYNNITVNRIVLLNPDGSIDNTFNIGTGLTGNGNFVIFDDNKFIVTTTGSSTTYNGTPTNGIIRLNIDGSIDNTFTGSIIGTVINQVIKQDDNKYLLGGSFTEYNGNLVNRIVRINNDGSYDSTFNIGSGFNTTVTKIFIDINKKIYVTGGFSTYNGDAYHRIISLNSGITTNLINQKTSFNTFDNTYVKDIKLSGNNLSITKGDVEQLLDIFSCDFDIITSLDINDYIPVCTTEFINNYGTVDHSFNMPGDLTDTSTYRLNTIAIQNDDKIIIGGNFNSYLGNTVYRLLRFFPNGEIDNSFNIGTGPSGEVNDVTIDNNQKIIVTGSFINFNSNSSSRIARIQLNGSYDSTFVVGTGFNSLFGGDNINNIKTYVRSTDEIICIGNFSTYNGDASNRIVQILDNGTRDTTFNIGNGFNANVRGLVIQNDGKIIVVGRFTEYRSTAINRIVRINTNGTIDGTFNVGTGLNNADAYSIGIQSDGKIIVSGNFNQYNGNTANNIVRINTDGSYDNTFVGSTYFNFISNNAKLKIVEDDKIIISRVTTYNGISTNKSFLKLNSDGTVDNTFDLEIAGNEATAFEVDTSNQYFYAGINIDQTSQQSNYNSNVIKFNNNQILQNTQKKIHTNNLNLGDNVNESTSTVISFTEKTIYGTADTPLTGNLTDDLSDAKLGITQKIYHNSSIEPTVPVGWVLIGNTSYVEDVLNIIYVEWASGSRVEYWIGGADGVGADGVGDGGAIMTFGFSPSTLSRNNTWNVGGLIYSVPAANNVGSRRIASPVTGTVKKVSIMTTVNGTSASLTPSPTINFRNDTTNTNTQITTTNLYNGPTPFTRHDVYNINAAVNEGDQINIQIVIPNWITEPTQVVHLIQVYIESNNVIGISNPSFYDMSFAISDEETPITTGTEKVTLFTPRAFTLTNVKASLSNSGLTQTEIDIKVNGLSILSTNITIDAGDKKSVDALTQPVISNSNISEDDEITVDIVSAGSGATGAKIYLIGTI